MKLKYNTNSKFWKMDTSHSSIISKFLNTYSFKIQKAKDYEFEKTEKSYYKILINNRMYLQKNAFSNEFSYAAIHQYLRILSLYGFFNHQFYKIVNQKSVREMMESLIGIEIDVANEYSKMQSFDEMFYNNQNHVEYMLKNLEFLQTQNGVFSEALNDIVYTIESFSRAGIDSSNQELINYFDKNVNFKKKINNYLNGVIDERRNYLIANEFQKLSLLFGVVNSDITYKEVNDALNKQKSDFEQQGFFGEKLVDEMLKQCCNEHNWISKRNKYSSFDFECDDQIIEVKTTTSKFDKAAFHISYNEYELAKTKGKKYSLWLIKLNSKATIDKMMRLISEGKPLLQYLKKEIDFSIEKWDGDQLLQTFNFSPKGFWVSQK